MSTENKTEVNAEMTEAQAESEVIEIVPTEEEPRIIIFPDEEETAEETTEEPEVTETEDKEKYVPKAVAYRQTLGITEDTPREKTTAEIEAEKICAKAKLIRENAAWMLERPLFNVPAWLALGVIFGSIPPLYVTLLLIEHFYGKLQVISETFAYGVVMCITMQVVLGIISFIGMRITVVSARNSGGNMTTAGLTMLRTAAAIMIIEPILGFSAYPSVPTAIVCGVLTLFLITLLVSVNAVRKTIIDSKIYKLSPVCGILFFVQALMYGYTAFRLAVDLDSANLFIGMIALVLGTVSMFMFGIFVFAYNANMRKLKKELEAE